MGIFFARFRASQNRDNVGLHVLPYRAHRGVTEVRNSPYPIDALEHPYPPPHGENVIPALLQVPPLAPLLLRPPTKWKQPRGIQKPNLRVNGSWRTATVAKWNFQTEKPSLRRAVHEEVGVTYREHTMYVL